LEQLGVASADGTAIVGYQRMMRSFWWLFVRTTWPLLAAGNKTINKVLVWLVVDHTEVAGLKWAMFCLEDDLPSMCPSFSSWWLGWTCKVVMAFSKTVVACCFLRLQSLQPKLASAWPMQAQSLFVNEEQCESSIHIDD
jgi:hypothetical protein